MSIRANPFVKLFEDPGLIQSELDRRLEAARHAIRQSVGKMRFSATSLACKRASNACSPPTRKTFCHDELRHRMPDLRQREHAIRAALQSNADQTTGRTAYLRLSEIADPVSRPSALVGRSSRHHRASTRGTTARQGDLGRR